MCNWRQNLNLWLKIVVFVGNYSRLVPRVIQFHRVILFCSFNSCVNSVLKFQCVLGNREQRTVCIQKKKNNKNELIKWEKRKFHAIYCCVRIQLESWFMVNFRIKKIMFKSRTCPFELNFKWIRLWLADILFEDFPHFFVGWTFIRNSTSWKFHI